jgi:hypothetical protein
MVLTAGRERETCVRSGPPDSFRGAFEPRRLAPLIFRGAGSTHGRFRREFM